MLLLLNITLLLATANALGCVHKAYTRRELKVYWRFKHRMHERLSVPDAAKRLNISEGALRQRINRGTIEHEKDDDGRV